MVSIFYIAGLIAISASIKVISSKSSFSALLYLIISLLASAVIFLSLGAYFSTALELILFIGAASILFISVISFLDLNSSHFKQQERQSLTPKVWLGPLILIFVLFVTLIFSIASTDYESLGPTKNSDSLFSMSDILLGPYILVIELAALLILGGLVVAYHFAHDISADEDGLACETEELPINEEDEK
ncbi:NADH-quinone oxidoreductase subunit J [Utexia brackfieldae]|uniref:NADH-quinone oxidoreductase subunit J n=1 Tax=Utexia brackfieldae TaxID=3074108 RepID=UPI00370D259F